MAAFASVRDLASSDYTSTGTWLPYPTKRILMQVSEMDTCRHIHERVVLSAYEMTAASRVRLVERLTVGARFSRHLLISITTRA
jgi:hypothetical protein